MRSYAEVTLPPDFPTPVVKIDENSRAPDFVYVDGVEDLADVQAVYYGRSLPASKGRILGIGHRQDTVNTAIHDFRISINTEEHETALSTFPPVYKRQVYVAAAGPGFHDFGAINENVTALPEGVSNVTNGVGYLAGIVSKTVPYKSCYDEDDVLVPCPLEPAPW
ncbi:hypothetical protein [Fodinibius salsisoli]|uniref:Uncharacterized protein n=1 Tax=Fodinibius salsisoli TaxID=2820877 RepID=A0ABT3PHL4_9BACT|nr:hypothetical protein [Fodinibius salsisoli]MCW9705405.1 hypothetical protein [Fodinibius salsisoli]